MGGASLWIEHVTVWGGVLRSHSSFFSFNFLFAAIMKGYPSS